MSQLTRNTRARARRAAMLSWLLALAVASAAGCGSPK